jgi:hypothetical protein
MNLRRHSVTTSSDCRELPTAYASPGHAQSLNGTLLCSQSGAGAQNKTLTLKCQPASSAFNQYLDTNAVGALVKLGSCVSNCRWREVIIRTHAVTLEAEAATLRLFDNHLDLQQRILVVAPHPDDAEVAAFGLYADRQASVVTVTAGNAGDMNYRASVSDRRSITPSKAICAVDSVTIPWQAIFLRCAPPISVTSMGNWMRCIGHQANVSRSLQCNSR